jgi:hypothetical protein
MAYDLTPEGNKTALKTRRADLRALSEEFAELVARMPLPETYLEAERGARAVWVADRALVKMRVGTLGGEEDEAYGGGPLRQPPLDAASATSPASAGEEKESDPSGPSATARAAPLPMKNGEEKDAESPPPLCRGGEESAPLHPRH